MNFLRGKYQSNSLLLKHFFLGLFFLFFFLFSPSFVLAANKTWDGGGTDQTCGGNPGDGNKWSCVYNWSGDTLPTSSDVAIFDNTSSKNCVIDVNITLVGLTINSGYSGTITQNAEITLTTSGFTQYGGSFVGGSQKIDINDGSFNLQGGSFTSTSGILSVERNFTVSSAASFNANSGTVQFDGGNYDSSTITCTGNENFNLVSISKT
ncbi:MAG: hypothetical protein ACPLKP_00590, partial [Microgenomates group bacterium]